MQWSLLQPLLDWRYRIFAGSESDPTLFVVASMPRSGTHMLRTLLNEHPNIRVENELFNPKSKHNQRWVKQSAQWVLGKKAWRPGRQSIRGVLVHLCQEAPWHVWRHLQTRNNVRYVCLRRRNMLEQFVSRQQANVHHRWQAVREKDRPELRPMPVDRLELERYFNEMSSYWDRFEQAFSKAPRLTVWYEDLCLHTEEHSLAIQEFLGAKQITGLQPSTIKIGRPTSELISNYAELQRHFLGTKHASLFEPAGIDQSKRTA